MNNVIREHFPNGQYECRKGKQWERFDIKIPSADLSLQHYNKHGFEVYFTPTEFTKSGVREKEFFKAAHAIWIDYDHEKFGSIDIQEHIKTLPLTPSMVIESSPGNYHIYWFTYTEDIFSFESIMRRLVKDHQHDKGACLSTQLLRVPKYYSHKRDTPHMVDVAHYNGRVHDWVDIEKAFPPILEEETPKRTTDPNNKGRLELREAISEMLRGEIEYPNMRDIAGSLAAKGIYRQDITDLLGGILDAAREAGVEKARMDNCDEKLIECVDSAMAKYAPDRRKYAADDLGSLNTELDWPPGFLGELSQYIHTTMILPSKEIAIVSALNLVATLGCGCYHHEGMLTGRKYVILARNGRGKSWLRKIFNRIASTINIPNLRSKVMMPESFSSVNLQEATNEGRVRTMIISEKGLRSQSTAGDKANIEKFFLDSLAADIWTDVEMPTKSKSGSNKSTPVYPTWAPMISIIEESTPSTFADGYMSGGNVSSGALARTDFFFIADENIEGSNRDYHRNLASIPSSIQKRMDSLARQYFNANVHDGTDETVVERMIEADFTAIEEPLWNIFEASIELRSTDNEEQRAMYVRMAEKVKGICLILAAADSCNESSDEPEAPVATMEHLEWAKSYVEEINRAYVANSRGGVMADAMDRIMKKLEFKLRQPDAASKISRQWMSRQFRSNQNPELRALKQQYPYKSYADLYNMILEHACLEGLVVKNGNYYIVND